MTNHDEHCSWLDQSQWSFAVEESDHNTLERILFMQLLSIKSEESSSKEIMMITKTIAILIIEV